METIDEIVFGSGGPEKVDFIKIDAAWFERQILAGAAETVRGFKPVIACSGYHLPGDEKIIPEIVLGLNPGYKFRILDRATKI